jgi:hypothetical protein
VGSYTVATVSHYVPVLDQHPIPILLQQSGDPLRPRPVRLRVGHEKVPRNLTLGAVGHPVRFLHRWHCPPRLTERARLPRLTERRARFVGMVPNRAVLPDAAPLSADLLSHPPWCSARSAPPPITRSTSCSSQRTFSTHSPRTSSMSPDHEAGPRARWATAPGR